MKTRVPTLAHDVRFEKRTDGSLLLASNHPLNEVANNTGVWLHKWSETAPDRTFMAERSGDGWRSVTYNETMQQVRAIAASLLARGLTGSTPVLILSGNGVDHGLLMLAAQYAGIPTVAVAEQYSLIPAAHNRLQHVVELVRPSLIYASDAETYRAALELEFLDGIEKVSSAAKTMAVTEFDTLLKGDTTADVDAAHRRVGPDTLAKILLTSGSTSLPKGVETTQRMLCANQAQIGGIMPLFSMRAPIILDWLPWNHTFGGSHNFNMILANGGSLYIDDGKPLKHLFGRSLENLSMVSGTISFNVPVGFSLMLDAFRQDAGLRQKYFEDLDMIFYAGASLPLEIWRGLEQMALEVSGSVPLLTSSWGLTETAPSATSQHEPTESSGIIGVPLPGISAKLTPIETGRFEIRIKGPNVMIRYHKAPEKTAEAFDEEGYFITGDAVRFVDADNPGKGLRFDGRISEDFKLLTGTWVRASALRLDLLGALAPLAADLIVTGQDRNDIGILIVPNHEALSAGGLESAEADGLLAGKALFETIASRLTAFNERNSASSTRIARAAILAEPPSMADGEMTAKGNLNFARIMVRRAPLLERLYDDTEHCVLQPEESRPASA